MMTNENAYTLAKIFAVKTTLTFWNLANFILFSKNGVMCTEHVDLLELCGSKLGTRAAKMKPAND